MMLRNFLFRYIIPLGLLAGLIAGLLIGCSPQVNEETTPTMPPSTHAQPVPAYTVTPSPVPPTATTTPSPVPSDMPTPTATLEVICPEVGSSSATTLTIQGMILFEEVDFGMDYKETIYGLSALNPEPQLVIDVLPQGAYSEFYVSFDGKWLAARYTPPDDQQIPGQERVLMVSNTQEHIILSWEEENWMNIAGWLPDPQRLIIVPRYGEYVVQRDEIIALDPFTGYQERIAPELPYPEDIYLLMDAKGHTAYYDPTLTRVAYKISDATLVLWDLEEMRELWRLVEPTLMIREQATWSPDGNFLAVVDVIGDQTTPIRLDENVTFQTLLIDRKGEVVWQDPYSYYGDWTSSTVFTWSPNGRYVALSRMSINPDEPRILILDTTSMEVSDYCISRRVGSRVIWSPDSQQFIVWSTQQGTPSGEDKVYQNILVDLSGDTVVRLEGISFEPVAWIDTNP